ncbi:MAG: hypothetical protein ACO1Q7_07850, partial [Gemmatimonas sp.]
MIREARSVDAVEAASLTVLNASEPVTGLSIDGVRGWTTTTANGSFGLGSDEPVGVAMDRWSALQADLQALGVERLASAHQVHDNVVSVHGGEWKGGLRQRGG